MSDARKLFRIVVWLGVDANGAFGLWVTFLDPHRLLDAVPARRPDERAVAV